MAKCNVSVSQNPTPTLLLVYLAVFQPFLSSKPSDFHPQADRKVCLDPRSPEVFWKVDGMELCDEGTSSPLLVALLFGKNAQTLRNKDTYAVSTSLIQRDCRYFA